MKKILIGFLSVFVLFISGSITADTIDMPDISQENTTESKSFNDLTEEERNYFSSKGFDESDSYCT